MKAAKTVYLLLLLEKCKKGELGLAEMMEEWNQIRFSGESSIPYSELVGKLCFEIEMHFASLPQKEKKDSFLKRILQKFWKRSEQRDDWLRVKCGKLADKLRAWLIEQEAEMEKERGRLRRLLRDYVSERLELSYFILHFLDLAERYSVTGFSLEERILFVDLVNEAEQYIEQRLRLLKNMNWKDFKANLCSGVVSSEEIPIEKAKQPKVRIWRKARDLLVEMSRGDSKRRKGLEISENFLGICE